MISDRQLARAILALKPDGVQRMELAHIDCPHLGLYWEVAMHDDAMLACHECVSQTDPLLSTALDKANSSLVRKRDEIARRDDIALAYSKDWSATS